MTDFHPTTKQMRFIANNFALFCLYTTAPVLAALLLEIAQKAADHGTGTVPLRELAKRRTKKHNAINYLICNGHLSFYGEEVGYSASFSQFLAHEVKYYACFRGCDGREDFTQSMPYPRRLRLVKSSAATLTA